MREFIIGLGGYLNDKLIIIGEWGIFLYRIVKACFSRPFDLKQIREQIDEIGYKSLPIVVLSALSIGMVMVLQLAFSFKRFGARGLVGPVVALSIVRELGPIITSLLVGGRVGSGITAEIGSMQVTEQIDAIRTLGADPIKKLVVPRFIAALISFPILAIVADFVGIIGGMIMADIELGVAPRQFIESLRVEVAFTDFFSGVLKTVFFGLLVATIASFIGMRAAGGTQGVGRATTVTVVVSLVLIIISDFFLTKFLLLLWPEF